MFLVNLDILIKYFFINVKYFLYFNYVINLVKDCEFCLEKVIKSENRRICKFDKDVMVKVVGNLIDGNFNLLLKVKGK